jgi:hypothetical protein
VKWVPRDSQGQHQTNTCRHTSITFFRCQSLIHRFNKWDRYPILQLSGLLQGDLKLFLTRVHHDGHSWSASCGQWFVAKHAAILPRQPTHSVWVNDITFLDVSSVLVCQAIRWSNLLSLMISHELQGGSLWPLAPPAVGAPWASAVAPSSFLSPLRKKVSLGPDPDPNPIPHTMAQPSSRSRLKDYKISWYLNIPLHLSNTYLTPIRSLSHHYSGWWLTYPSEKYEGQLGFMFQTTNQYLYNCCK